MSGDRLKQWFRCVRSPFWPRTRETLYCRDCKREVPRNEVGNLSDTGPNQEDEHDECGYPVAVRIVREYSWSCFGRRMTFTYCRDVTN